MDRLRYRTKIDIGVSVITIAIGAFFLYQVSLIETLQSDAIGPSLFPNFLALAMIALGVLIGASALLFNATARRANEAHSIEEEAEETFGFRDSDIKRVSAVIFMGFVYIALFYAFGYLISTFLSLALMLLVFGNRRPLQILILSVIGALAYDYVFMNLMGLYDPPGALFDLQSVLGS